MKSASWPVAVQAGARFGALAVAAVVLLAGVLKLADLSEFERSLGTWNLFESPWLRGAALVGVPGFEVIVGGSVLFSGAKGRAAVALVVLISLVTVAYGWEVATGKPPDCGCWGAFSRFVSHRQAALMVLVRNGVMLAIVVIWLAARPKPAQPRVVPAPTSLRRVAARGWSLIEVLVVIAVLGVLLVVALPTLGMWKRTGRDAGTRSLARQHAITMSTYAQEYRDTMPYFTVPKPGEFSPITLSQGQVIHVTYFGAFSTWPHVLGPGMYRSPGTGALFVSPWATDTHPWAFDYLYPCTFIAHPDYWDDITRADPSSQLVPTRVTDIRFPDAKAMVVDDAMWQSERAKSRGERRTAVGCADGSGDVVGASRLAPQCRQGDGAGLPYREYTRHFASYNPLLHTTRGVWARDLLAR